MIILPVQLLTLPIVLAIWALDSVLFLITTRLVAGKFLRMRSSTAYGALEHLTEPVFQRAEDYLANMKSLPSAPWASRVLVILALLVTRYVLVGLVMVMA